MIFFFLFWVIFLSSYGKTPSCVFPTLNSFRLVLHQSNDLVLFLFVIACVLKCLLDVLMGGIVNLVAWQEEGFSLSVPSFAGRFRPPDP